LSKAGRQAAFLNAYPPGYFKAIESGRRLFSAIPLAVSSAGIPLMNAQDLANGRALSADFTSQGWRENLGFKDVPLLTPREAGNRLADLAQEIDFAFFEYWLSDYAGHHQDMDQAIQLLETLDGVLQGLSEHWDDSQGLVLITSDHGNMEDLSTRRHTDNPVPALLIGAPALRRRFARNLHSLADVAPAILDLTLNL
jgi:2,3-bisphosphoglycerate-independent phosphoglycerate mutase